MAITPRTIFSSAAPATVAAVSLLAFTAVGTVAYMSSQKCSATKEAKTHAASGTLTVCDNVRQALGTSQAQWSEGDWVHYATCFERRDHSQLAVDAATDGLRHYPNSEALYNIKGYHEIVMDEHAQAISTLSTGLKRVGHPYSGVMENNLAWASLWAPRELELDKARTLYENALQRESNVCAYLHTGLWVEYAQSKQSSGVERFEAMRKFDNLRDRYEPCMSRLGNGEWKTVVEVAGAAALFADLEQDGINGMDRGQASGSDTLRQVADVLQTRYRDVTVDELCRDAMPLETTHHTCMDQLSTAMAEASRARLPRAKDAKSAGSGGGSPCPMTR